jgi:hypothetical protein
MAARNRDMVERGDWRTGDQASLNALIWRGKLRPSAADWGIMRPFAPPYFYYRPDRAPVIGHFAGDIAVKRHIWTYPGKPVELSFPEGQDPYEDETVASAVA